MDALLFLLLVAAVVMNDRYIRSLSAKRKVSDAGLIRPTGILRLVAENELFIRALGIGLVISAGVFIKFLTDPTVRVWTVGSVGILGICLCALAAFWPDIADEK